MSIQPVSRLAVAHARRMDVRRRWVCLGILVGLIVLCALWIEVRALAAKADLQSAIPLVTTLKTQVVAQDVAGAKKTLATLTAKTAAARSYTSDPIWRLAESVPLVGPNLSAARTLASATDDVATQAVRPLVGVLDTVSTSSLKPVNGALDLKPIINAAPTVDRAAAALTRAHEEVSAIDASATIGTVRIATTQLGAMLGSFDIQMQDAQKAVHALPKAMGSSGVRNYLVVFENSGELLANGGTTGSMALLQLDNGKVKLMKQSSASGRDFPSFADYVVPIPEDVQKLFPYGLGRQVQDLTITPRFSLTYEVAKAMWKSAKGDDIDGILALDTVTLAKLLKATGPIEAVPGLQINAENAARILLIDIYNLYPNAAVVDKITQTISVAAFSKILGGDADPKTLLSTLLTAADEGRVKLWSGDKTEQDLIKLTPFYSEPPESTKATDGLGVYFMDQTPSKMDYFLRVNVNVNQAVCSDNHRYVFVRVTLNSTAPANAADVLPEYVTGNGSWTPRGDVKIGTTVYAPEGYTVVGTALDTQPIPPLVGTDGTYTVAQGAQQMAPGQTQIFDVLFDAGETPTKKLSAWVTPTVNPTVTTYGTMDCGLAGK